VEKEWTRMVRSFSSTLKMLTECQDGKNREQDLVKYHIGRVACVGFNHVGDAVPVPKSLVGTRWEEATLFCGWFLSFILRARARRDVGFFQGLLFSKKVWEPLGVQRMRESLRDHANLICGLPPAKLDEGMEERILRTSRRVFAKLPPAQKFMPTGKASREHPATVGGTLNFCDSLKFPKRDEEKCFGGPTNLTRLQEAIGKWRHSQHNRVVAEVRRELAAKNSTSLHVHVKALPEPSKFRILSLGGKIMTAVQPAQGQLLTCWKRQAASTMLKDDLLPDVQRMLDDLNLPGWFFSSVDYKSSTDYLKMGTTRACAMGAQGLHNDDLAWISLMPAQLWYPKEVVDDEDELLPEAIQLAQDLRGKTWKDVERSIGCRGKPRVLYGPFQQTNGQLMGHPLSFPFLCTTNLSVYEEAVDQWVSSIVHWSEVSLDFWSVVQLVSREVFTSLRKREKGEGQVDETLRIFRSVSRDLWLGRIRGLKDALRSVMLRNVLINGDDALFRSCPSFEAVFWKTAARVGFLPSLGKNYTSNLMAMINNQLYRVDGTRVKRCGYLNQSLLMGFSPKKGNSPATPDQLGRDLNKMFELLPHSAGFLPMCFQKWEKLHGKLYCPNWFLPVPLGGYGVDPKWCQLGTHPVYYRLPARVTRSQLALAQAFIEKPDMSSIFKEAFGIRLPTKLLEKWIPTSRVNCNPTSEELAMENEWVARLAYAHRASLCGRTMDSIEERYGFDEFKIKEAELRNPHADLPYKLFSTLKRLPAPKKLLGNYGHLHRWDMVDLCLHLDARRIRFPGVACPPQEVLGGNVFSDTGRFGQVLSCGATWRSVNGVSSGGRDKVPEWLMRMDAISLPEEGRFHFPRDLSVSWYKKFKNPVIYISPPPAQNSEEC